MEYIGIGIVIAVAIAAGIIIYTKFNKREAIPSGDLVSVSTTSGKDELAEIHQENELIIQMEMNHYMLWIHQSYMQKMFN